MSQCVKPHSLGVNHITNLNVEDIHPWINKKLLFYKLWGFSPEALRDSALSEETENALKRMLIWGRDHIELSIAYGIFPCQSDGDMIKVYSPLHDNCSNCSGCSISGKDFSKPLKTLFFDRDISSHKTICDYFNSVHSHLVDFIGFQVVSAGNKAVSFGQKLKAEDQYQDYFYWYGYCAALTEALAGWTHAKIRREMGISGPDETCSDEWTMNYRGKRYSFGYNWCRDMSEQYKILDILRAGELDIRMNDSDELEPEFSTCAIVVSHPEAVYW